jgi:NADH:ubiquinone oxidoreductase subunit 4 (subunit M)
MPFVFVVGIVSVIYAGFTTIRQIDLKKIIAYTSVAHMNLVVIGLFTLNTQSLEGSILLMVGHGFVSSALFLSIGVLYVRHHTRILKYYSGLAYGMPIFASLFLFLSLSNLGFPGTSNFVGELLIIAGIFKINTTVAIICSFGLILAAIYSI